MPGLRRQALQALLLKDPADKARAARELFDQAQAHPEALTRAADEAVHPTPDELAALPGRPERPRLVSATEMPTRSPFTPEGRAALLHAICHIEFNAIKKVFLIG